MIWIVTFKELFQVVAIVLAKLYVVAEIPRRMGIVMYKFLRRLEVGEVHVPIQVLLV
jgi:hypothetical protein